MSWTSYLPSSTEKLADLEWWLWFTAAILGILTIVVGVVAREVGRYHTGIEKVEVQGGLAAARAELEQALRQRDEKARQLEEIANKARQEAAAIRERQKPRTLNAEQKAKLTQMLSGGQRGNVYLLAAVAGDGEALDLAKELNQVLNAAGWHMENFAANWISTINVTGVTIMVHSESTAPSHADILQKALEAVGIQSPGQVDVGTPEGKFTVVVGHKPN